MKKDHKKRTVFAPQSALDASAQEPANRVISVELAEDEDVQWIWMSLPEGTAYVSGYNIIKKKS
ncbi:hypothetical protein C1752_14315 [Acaryochloris thomasi RCC1774]|uniref:Uncharacterized protein n=1 Tax=Acaryochloris thomasi RCC1774 TaxID=1764569 RepID=A0A2W1JJ82_9CYAN|nr:hypothetical protein [Acaryochloris thomasi]PZD70314.1 hypothetical protein C1752_14315 [Acaryochloris thomasi RCC1774]